MGVVLVCALLVAAGAVAVARWGDLPVVPPWPPPTERDAPDVKASLFRFLWYVDVAVVTGLVSGLVAAGAGGRLIMRLLAMTSGEAARGAVTEAEEIVGRVTLGGTIGFIVFAGFFSGVLVAALYLLIRRWLPPGRAGALLLGAFLLVVFATRVEPMRAGNPDFEILRPAWLAVAAFSALAFFHAAVVVAVAGRLSRALPLPTPGRPETLAAYLPVLLVLGSGPVGLLALVLGFVGSMASQDLALTERLRTPGAHTAGRVVLGAVALLSLPGFVLSVMKILAE